MPQKETTTFCSNNVVSNKHNKAEKNPLGLNVARQIHIWMLKIFGIFFSCIFETKLELRCLPIYNIAFAEKEQFLPNFLSLLKAFK